MALAAKRIIEQVENRTYFDDPWYLTGPALLRNVANGTGMLTSYNTRCWIKYWPHGGNYLVNMYLFSDQDDIYNITAQQSENAEKKNRILLMNPYGEDIHELMRNCKTCNNYIKLHKVREIYCDQPGEPCDGKDFM